MKTEGSASVKVTATVELHLTSSWQGSETMENLACNAGGEAIAKLERILRDGNARILGKPSITTVWFNTQDKPVDDFNVKQ